MSITISVSVSVVSHSGNAAADLQGFNPELWLLSVWNFACSSHVHLGFQWAHRFPSTMCKHVILID